MSHPRMLNRENSVLVVVDIQDILLRFIYEADRVTANSIKLIEAAKVLDVPVIVTLQNADRFGGCTQAIADALPPGEHINKMTFSCCGSEHFSQTLRACGRKEVILCGIETHVCVNQTAHDLLDAGYTVHIAKDAVSSRSKDNWKTGIEKMRDSGCIITSTEAAIFEIVKDASAPEFKRVLPIVK